MKHISTVLIVEDETILKEAYDIVLQSAGYRTILASNGQEALDHLTHITPDVILLDVHMPVMDGEELLQKLKKSDHSNMKIVVFSNNADRSMGHRLQEAGAERFVLKSELSPTGLIDFVKHLDNNQ